MEQQTDLNIMKVSAKYLRVKIADSDIIVPKIVTIIKASLKEKYADGEAVEGAYTKLSIEAVDSGLAKAVIEATGSDDLSSLKGFIVELPGDAITLAPLKDKIDGMIGRQLDLSDGYLTPKWQSGFNGTGGFNRVKVVINKLSLVKKEG